MIDTWEESAKLLRIAATIYVERPGQKAILIGAGGAALKKIGTLARKELEHIFDRKVFLQTFVKVRGRLAPGPRLPDRRRLAQHVGNLKSVELRKIAMRLLSLLLILVLICPC